MKPSIGFALGIVTGCAGLLLAQSFTKPQNADDQPPESEPRRLTSKPLDDQLVEARKRITELEAEAVAARSPAAGALAASGEVEIGAKAKEEETDTTANFLKMMMAFGDKESKRKIDEEVVRLTEILGLTENQQAAVRDALNKKVSDQKAAGVRLMTGKASVADLIASDEHNFASVDSALETVLDAEQLQAYQGVQEEREVKRIETKTDKELEDLAGATGLSDEQKDAAWQVLADINTEEKPGAVPEDTSPEDLLEFVDGSIDKRLEGLTPILTEEQLQVYQGQTLEFRKMVGALLGHATGAPVGLEE